MGCAGTTGSGGARTVPAEHGDRRNGTWPLRQTSGSAQHGMQPRNIPRFGPSNHQLRPEPNPTLRGRRILVHQRDAEQIGLHAPWLRRLRHERHQPAQAPEFPNTLYVQWQGGDSGCYDDQTRASPDYEVFDALLTEIENTFCIDKNRVFADGFSSGAWMAMMLGCQRANVIKAHGQGAGGLPISIRPAVDCKGPVAALFSHGTADDQNHIHGSRQDRDRLIKTNQCDSTTKPYGGFAQCVEYQNCYPATRWSTASTPAWAIHLAPTRTHPFRCSSISSDLRLHELLTARARD